MNVRFFVIVLLFAICPAGWGQGKQAPPPDVQTIDGGAGQPLPLLLYAPAETAARPSAAIVLFHGGGWTVGQARWMEPAARLMANAGMLAVSVEYRLADQAGVTPFDSVADARAALRWVRHNAARLGIDPQRIAAGGVSAGGHLAAAAAVFDEPFGDVVSARPDALVLWSPAVAVAGDGWFGKLTGGTARAAALSPDLHVRPGLPPTVLLQGEQDSVTPAGGAERFCGRMRVSGNRCELTVYPGVGHLFTRNLQQQEKPDYAAIDMKIDADADQVALAFLRDLGFAAR
jgi:acetyl esterase